MNYEQHVTVCILEGLLISLFGVQIVKSLSTQAGYPLIVSLDFIMFWIGAIPHMLVFTPDLDSATSKPTQFLDKLHINIFKPFTKWGHRDALHHWFWGPINLMSWWVIPLLFVGIHIPYSTLVGAVSMIWCHLGCDFLHDHYERSWVVKVARKVF